MATFSFAVWIIAYNRATQVTSTANQCAVIQATKAKQSACKAALEITGAASQTVTHIIEVIDRALFALRQRGNWRFFRKESKAAEAAGEETLFPSASIRPVVRITTLLGLPGTQKKPHVLSHTKPLQNHTFKPLYSKPVKRRSNEHILNRGSRWHRLLDRLPEHLVQKSRIAGLWHKAGWLRQVHGP